MRSSIFYALSALAATFAGVTLAEDLSTPENGLIKRGSSSYGCANPSDKLVHGGGSCSCKQSLGGSEKECEAPKSSKCGTSNCSPSGCTIQCNYGMQLNAKGDDCVCKPGYKLASIGSYCELQCGDYASFDLASDSCKCEGGYELCSDKKSCQPKCPAHSTYNSIYKGCECDSGYVRSGSTCIKKSCPANEKWNGYECVCISGYSRHTKTGKCSPGASQRARRNTKERSSVAFSRAEEAVLCPEGQRACPISSVDGGYECVDTNEELENCGGCTALGEGQDCTDIPGVSGVGCSKGQCVVFSCVSGYRLSSNGACSPSLTFSAAHEKRRGGHA